MTLEQRARDVVERLRQWEERTYGPCGRQERVSEKTLSDAAEIIKALLARIAKLEADRAEQNTA